MTTKVAPKKAPGRKGPQGIQLQWSEDGQTILAPKRYPVRALVTPQFLVQHVAHNLPVGVIITLAYPNADGEPQGAVYEVTGWNEEYYALEVRKRS